MAKDVIHLTITTEDVKHLLAGVLNIKNACQVADVIIGNLCTTEVGLKQTYLALQGIVREIKFKPEQEVYVEPDGIYSWRYDEQDMINEKLMINGLIPARVVSINKYAEQSIEIVWKYIDKSTRKLLTETQHVEQRHVHDGTDKFLDK